MSETDFRKGDLVEHIDGDKFVDAGQLGRVAYSPIETGPRAFMVEVEWFNDTTSFLWPRALRLVARPDSTPPQSVAPSHSIDIESKTITGVIK